MKLQNYKKETTKVEPDFLPTYSSVKIRKFH